MQSNQVLNIGSKNKHTNIFNTMETNTPFRKSVFYINNTPEEVIIVHRNNLPVRLRKSLDSVSMSNAITIRTIYKFNTSKQIVETINMIDEYQKLNGSTAYDLNIIGELLLKAFNDSGSVSNIEIVLDIDISLKDLQKNKVCYNADSDLLIMYKDYHVNIPHPYSAEGRTVRQYRDLIKDHKCDGFLIELIDNENSVKKRFMSYGKDCMEITAKEDPSRPSGIYIAEVKTDEFGNVGLRPSTYSIEDAESKLGLFTSMEEAMSNGNADHLAKKQLIKSQTELESLKTENLLSLEKLKNINEKRSDEVSVLKHQHEIDLLKEKQLVSKMESDARTLRAEYDSLKNRIDTNKIVTENIFEEKSMARNDYYDSRSSTRKDTNEYVKLTAAVVITGLGVYAAMRKYNS